MKKRFLLRKCLLALGMVASVASISSCSAFFGGTDYTISNIEQSVDSSTGETIITIIFSDETIEPLIIRVPQVTNGVGISNITANYDNGSVKLIISYTDETKPNTEIDIPVISGENGVGITGVDVSEDQNGNMTLQFFYSDGTQSDKFVIPQGKDGVGIANIVQTEEENGQHKVKITFTDDSLKPVEFYINDGVSIDSVEYSEEYSNEENYALIIRFSDGTSSIQFLPRPTTNKWYSGLVDPSQSLGKNGDFYLNESNGNVFNKKNEQRVYLFSMKGDSTEETAEYFNVIFNFAGDEYNDELTPGSKVMVKTKKGDTVPLEQIPIPKKDGYIFEGWYAGNDVNNPNIGKFTNLTIVSANVDLYARWSSIT